MKIVMIAADHPNLRPSYYLTVILMVNLVHANLYAQPSGYSFGKQIRINSAQVSGSSSLVNFPVLISLIDNDLRTTSNGGSVENSNGYDIVFTLDDCSSILDHQIEHYDASTGTFVAWVRIPSLSATADTDIGMFYGNSSISADPSALSTWNSDYISVYHLHDDFLDATASGNNGTNFGSIDISGIIGDGQDFDGIDDYVQTSSGELQTENDFTISAWFKADSTTMRHIIWQGISSQNGWGNSGNATDQEMHLSTGSCCLGSETSDLVSAYMGNDEDETDSEVLTAQIAFTDTSDWHYGVARYSDLGGTPMIELFIDGTSVDTDDGVADASTARNNWDTNLRIGRPGAATRYFDGSIDEVRLSSVVRSDDWIATEYNNQSNPGSFYSVSSQFAATTACSILPVELLYFKAEVEHDQVLLSWATASEKDFDFFTIQKSSDNVEYYNIGTVPGNGNSLERIEYSFIDPEPLVGRSFYRLTATDFDGSVEYFNIESVIFDDRFVKIYPRVISSGQPVNLLVSIEQGELATVTLISSQGKQIYLEKFSPGKHLLVLPSLSAGLYFVQIHYSGVTNSTKLIVSP